MAIKGLKSTQLANDPTTSALKFNFKTYEQKNSPFYNNSTNIDFVTYNGSLYVCVENGVSFKAGDPANNGFLLLVQKGADGRQGVDGKEGPMGPMPNYTLSFDGKQMVVVEQPTGIRKAVSPDLTGPVWVPELHDKKIVWVKEESSANTRPADIDLEQLRPVEERPLLLRTNSDNTKRSDESSGPANVIQWKHEGDEYWTNLISISELMNLTLAGVSFWQDEEDDNSWHFGHKEVLKATYSSSKDATKIVAVELGDVLYDAGKVPFPDNSIDLEAIRIQLDDLDRELQLLNLRIPTRVGQLENDVPYLKEADLSTYAKKSDILTDYVKSVKLNGTVHTPTNGQVDLGNIDGGSGTVDAYTKAESDARYQPKGNYLTQHQSLAGLVKGVKVNNGGTNYPDTNGIVNLTISGDGQPVDTSDCVKSVTINGDTKIPINGNVEFTIGNNTLFNLIVRNGHLIKIVNGVETDLGAIGSSGSGSTVTVRQVLLSGTKIATITVDGTDYDIYAPNGSSTEPGSGDGENAISLDLTNEMNTIPVDKSNKTLSTASFLTELHAFSGNNSEIGFTQDDVTVTISPNISGINVVKNIDNNPKKFQININSGITVESQVKITFTLWADDDSRSTRTINYNLIPLRLSQSEMFYLELDPDIIKVDSEENYTSETVSALPHWLLDGDPQSIVGWNDSSKINDVSVKYHVYYKIDNGNYTFYTSPVDITSASDQAIFELRYYYNNNKTDYIVMDGPEHVLIIRDGKNGQDGQDGDTTTILSQNRYYKASNQPTGVTAPASNLDPTLPANGSWLTNSNTIILDSTNAYLWMFERIVYSNNRIWQSDPVVIRFFNDQVEVDYDTLAAEVETRISDDLNDAKQRITNAENRLNNLDNEVDGLTTTTDDLTGRVTAVEARAVYSDNDIKALAETVINGKEATIKQWAGAEFDDKLSDVGLTLNAMKSTVDAWADFADENTGELNTVKSRLDAAEANIELAATKSELSGAINNARTEWRAADASITSTATKAQYVWMASDGSLLEYTTDDAANNRTSKESEGKTYTRTLISEAMSAIKQEADKVSILVGTDGNVKASVIADAINEGGSVSINANKINLLGETIATAIQAANISADQITSGTINGNLIEANSITSDKLAAGSIATDHLTTSLNGGSTVEIDGGLIKVRDSDEKVRIIIGQEIGDDTPVLKFYDNDGTSSQLGTLLYDLGPGGIFNLSGPLVLSTWTKLKFYYSSTEFSEGDILSSNSQSEIYKYEDAYRTVGSAIQRLSPFNINDTISGTSVMHNKYFSTYLQSPTQGTYANYFATPGYYIIDHLLWNANGYGQVDSSYSPSGTYDTDEGYIVLGFQITSTGEVQDYQAKTRIYKVSSGTNYQYSVRKFEH